MNSGLQAERTELAWLRTMVSCWAVGLLALKVVFPFGALALTAPVVLTVIGHRRRRLLRGRGVPPPLSRAKGIVVAMACVVIVITAL